ncbi:hepatic lectin-like [Mya arenaria]|uniref:hepatic lectin-like n=1 Tax=Mya arenaria TaxID=6604 RepID=UPI0022E1EE82|nr:hepatic lectin-like [Mya arenaria]
MAPTSTSPSTTASISTAPLTSTPITTTKHSTTPITITSTTRTATSQMLTSPTATASTKPTHSHTTSTFPSSTTLSYTQKCHAAGYRLLSTGDTHLCMHLKHSKHSWSNAEKVCERDHARLVVLDTHEKVEALRHTLDGNDYWIGATDDDHDDNFSWVNGEPISATFWLWGHGEPDRHHDFCVILNGHDHKMHDKGCADSHMSVCEIPL